MKLLGSWPPVAAQLHFRFSGNRAINFSPLFVSDDDTRWGFALLVSRKCCYCSFFLNSKFWIASPIVLKKQRQRQKSTLIKIFSLNEHAGHIRRRRQFNLKYILDATSFQVICSRIISFPSRQFSRIFSKFKGLPHDNWSKGGQDSGRSR